MGIFSKAYTSVNVYLDNFIEKSRKSVAYKEQKSLDFDPDYPAGREGGYKEKHGTLTFETLRQMAQKNAIVSSIFQTRINQVAMFSRPQKDRYSMGFKIRLKDHTKDPTEDDIRLMQELEQFILNTGYVDEQRTLEERESFEVFLRKITRDRLISDQVAVEVIPMNNGKLHHFVVVSGGTIRFAHEDLKSMHRDGLLQKQIAAMPGYTNENKDGLELKEDEEYRYAQVYKGRVVSAFTEDELIFRVGNPVADLDSNGYSVGELELLVNTITAHLQAENYNKLFFTHGQASKGLLHIKGNMPRAQLDAFRRNWHNQVSGNPNSWRTPIVGGAEDVKWIDLHTSNRDMEFAAWINYLVKVICAIFQIDPMEINFDISRGGGSGGSEALGGSGSFRNEERIKLSKNRGLKPILRFIENMINDEIIARINDRFVFEFVGLDSETVQQELERHTREIKTFKTINEVRREHDMEELKLEDLTDPGNFILDSTFVSIVQTVQQAAQAKENTENDPDNQDDMNIMLEDLLDEDQDNEDIVDEEGSIDNVDDIEDNTDIEDVGVDDTEKSFMKAKKIHKIKI